MNKQELLNVINDVVRKELREILTPQLIKPLVQEAVAGAMANLLAEGIVKGPPVKSTVSHTPSKPAAKERAPELTREEIRRRFLSEQEELSPQRATGRSPVSNILEMVEPFSDDELSEGGPIQSVLDVAKNSTLNETVSTAFLTRNYADLVKKIDEKRR